MHRRIGRFAHGNAARSTEIQRGVAALDHAHERSILCHAFEHLGFPAALTGPIVRGDVDAVRLHLGRLSPSDRSLYSALGRETLRLARLAGLDPDRAAELESLLAVD